MPETLTFMMGEFAAEFPTDRQYAINHMWAQQQPDGNLRFGFSGYAVRLLQDVYFLDWSIDAPATLTAGQEMGSIESKKAESSLYSPLQANLLRFNDELMEDPSAINTDKHERGWLFETDNQKQEEAQQLLSAEAYLELLVTVWEKTQRTIKGQLNE